MMNIRNTIGASMVPVLLATVSLFTYGTEEEPTEKGGATEIVVVQEKEEVRCEIIRGGGRGIGTAILRRTTETWPDPLLLRLHLRGLENLQLTAGPLTLRNGVSSGPDFQFHASLLEEERKETILEEKSPYWSPVRLVTEERKIPLLDGYFEYTVPRKLLEGDPETLEVLWIDFYR